MAADSLLSSHRSPKSNAGHQVWQQASFTLSNLIGPGLVWFVFAGVLGIKHVPCAYRADTLPVGPPFWPRGRLLGLDPAKNLKQCRCDGVCGTGGGGEEQQV